MPLPLAPSLETQNLRNVSRRAFLRRSAFGVGAATLALGYGTLIEPGELTLEKVTVHLRDLPTAFEGFRLAVLSDFHLHPFTSLRFIESAVRLANDLRPDLAMLLGDYVDARLDAIDELAPALAKLQAAHGIVAVLGNHDYRLGPEKVQQTLETAGIRVLQNSGLRLVQKGRTLYFAGLESAFTHRFPLAHAMAEYVENAPAILLAHEPDQALRAQADPRIGLQISGHTHGGQIRLPLVGALSLPYCGQHFDQGLFQLGALQIYTTRGLGLTHVPVRINCPPEVTEITLARL